MKKVIGLTALVLSAYALEAQTTQIVRWVNTVGGSTTSPASSRQQDAIKGMVEDGQMNTYVIGNYTGTISFNEYTAGINGAAQTPMTVKTFNSVSGSQDVYVARYDINGYCTFATSIGGAGFDEGNAICMSNPASPSDFYITGMFNLSMTVEGTTLDAVNSGYQVNDAFIIRYNTTMTTRPTLNWKTAFGGYTETCGNAIAVSGSNVYVTGYYTEYVMDASSNLLLQKTDNAGNSGMSFSTPTPGYMEFPYRDLFVARFSTAGVYSDALRSYGSVDQVEANGIVISGSSLYITGMYKGSTRFTSASPVACSGHSDAFIAQYPTTFTSTTPATAATTMGGPSIVYQSAPTMPFYKQDAGFGICASNFGIFATGRFMDQASFGTGSPIDPSGAATETYMYLVRFPAALTGAGNAVTGSNGYSEGRGLFLATGGIFSPTHTLFVVGGGMSTASVNGSQIETNGYTGENVGFVARIGYTNSTSTWANSFVDGIAQNQNGLNGTGTPDINCVGFAVSYRVGCGVRIGGRFSGKTAFGNREKTSSGTHDGFLSVRENTGTITSSFENCGSAVLTGSGGTSPMWTGPGVSSPTYTVTVNPPGTATYTYSASVGGSCPATTSPVTVYNFLVSSANAGPDQNICEATHTVVIGTPAVAGTTYSWTGSCGTISSPSSAQTVITIPGSSSTSCTYTVQVTDHCGTITSDVVTVVYDATCPHRLAGPEEQSTTSSFVVYPNPNNGLFNITCSNDLAKDVYVYDMNGRLVYSNIQTTETILSIDISSEAKGLYMVKVVNGNNVQTEKISNQ